MSNCSNHKICIDSALSEAEKICHQKNIRLTEIRKTILKIIWQSHKATKAYDILDQISGMNFSAKPPTVYRALDFLLENGFIHKINSLNSYIGCPNPLQNEQCYFIICSSCDEIEECSDKGITNAIESVMNKNKFSHKNIAIEINGTCNNCLDNRK